jgi:oxygen-dependent protoporphyrinogen oxidase
MGKRDIKIVVLGAGISGLATAYWLDKQGYEIKIIESRDEPGGSMESREEDGFLIDYGPNSGLYTTPLIGQLVSELGLDDQFIYAGEKGNKRYIFRDNQLHALPTNPPAFLKTKLFSNKAKARALMEPFIGRSRDGYYQSISDFVIRRLGREFLDYAINPFVSGVYAGNPDKLSVKSAFPKLYRLEEVYGGLFKGLIKGARERRNSKEQSKQSARMFSFRKGMQTLPKAIADKLNGRISYNCKAERVVKSGTGYEISFTHANDLKTISADIVLSAIPAYQAGLVFGNKESQTFDHFNNIYYPPVEVLYLVYKKEAVDRLLDGFGFLVPAVENKSFLGAIWSSTIFSDRASDEYSVFTLYLGGARSPEIFEEESTRLIEKVIKEFSEIMGIQAAPLRIRERMWTRAIPQYNIGYIEHERFFEDFEIKNPGIFLSGNYRGGISVGDCIKNSEITCKRINDYAVTLSN